MRRKGFGALAVVLLITSLLVIATSGVGDDAVRLLHSNTRLLLQRKANHAAYAALQMVLAQLDKQTLYDSTARRYISTWDPGQDWTNLPLDGDPEVRYSVRLINNSRGDLGAPFHSDLEDVDVPAGTIHIQVDTEARPAGHRPGRTYRASLASLGFIGQIYWQHAILATHGLWLDQGSVVDAFASNEGPGGPSHLRTDLASVGCNGIRDAIHLAGGATLAGNMRWGPSGLAAEAVVEDGSATVTGLREASRRVYRIPRFKPPYHPKLATRAVRIVTGSEVLEPGAYQSLYVGPGAKAILQARAYDPDGRGGGQYYFDQSVHCEGGSIEVVSADGSGSRGRVELYVGELLWLSHQARVNAWTSAADRSQRLQVMFVGSGSPRSPQRLLVEQASQLYAVVLGPGLDARLDSGGELYGALRAYDLHMSGQSKAHWDQSISLDRDSRIRGQIAWTLQGLIDEGNGLGGMDVDLGDIGSEHSNDSGGGGGGDGTGDFGGGESGESGEGGSDLSGGSAE
ncbi:MAG: hypothetical protein U0931_28940 [Vulcanimicrobiota bacterium]